MKRSVSHGESRYGGPEETYHFIGSTDRKTEYSQQNIGTGE
jgi:hypothetical protein